MADLNDRNDSCERPIALGQADGCGTAEAGESITGRHLAGLLSTIEGQIIPRLVLAYSASEEPTAPTPTQSEVLELSRLSLEHEADVMHAFVQAVHLRGVPLDRVFTELLTPAARHLGTLWQNDSVDFTQVTIALWRLQAVLRQFSCSFSDAGSVRANGLTALLATVPGEQHSFGISIVAEFFRASGWDVNCVVGASRTELLDLVASEWFDVIGISVGSEVLARQVPSLVRDLRGHARNRDVQVLLGGAAMFTCSEPLGKAGADALCVDAREALAVANEWARARFGLGAVQQAVG
jgi:methanogenic corrinoid protein MtbC1